MTEESQPDSSFGCLLRLFWSLAGPGLVLAAGALLIVDHPPFGSWGDYVVLGLAVLVGAARLLDRGEGREPGSPSPVKYLAALAGAVALILLIAHVVAPRLA